MPAGYLLTLKKRPTTLIQNLVHNKVFEMHPSIFSQETIKWKTSTPILAWNLRESFYPLPFYKLYNLYYQRKVDSGELKMVHLVPVYIIIL